MRKRYLQLVVPIALLALFAATANAAGHQDSPSVEGDPSADITDVAAGAPWSAP